MRNIKKTDWTLANPGRGALRVALDGVLLLLGLGGTLFTAVSAWSLDAGARSLLLICVLLSALFLLIFSLPRFRWLAALLTFAACALAFWRLRETLLEGGLQIAEDVLDTLSKVFDVPSFSIGPRPMDAERRRRVVTLTLAAAAVPLGGALAWAIIRVRSAFLTLVLTLPWYLPAILADAVPELRPLAALTACYCLLLLTSTGARHDPRGSARFTLLCIPAVALLLAGTAYFLPPEEYKAPEWSEEVRARAEKTANAVVKGTGLQPLLPGNGVDATVRLDECGPRHFTGATVLSVTSDTPGRVYLRGKSAAVYTGTSWEPLPDSDYANTGLSMEDPFIEGVSPLNLPSRTAPGTDFSEMNVEYDDLSGIMYTPYQLANTPEEVNGVDFRYDAYLERRFGVREKNLYYRPGAEPSGAEPLTGDAKRAEEAYARFVFERYVDVPADFTGTMKRWLGKIEADPVMLDAYSQMMREILGSGEYERRVELEAADFVAALLAVSTKYDLNTPYTPEGEDFVDWFLNGSGRGYCVHYASAGTLLLRTFGIPTRYVEGYTAQIQAKDRPVAVKDSAAHAWVEVYLDGYGWYPVDMTPAAATGIERHSTLGASGESGETEQEEREEPENLVIGGNGEEEEEEEAPAPAPVEKEEEKPKQAWWFWPLPLVLSAVPLQSVLRRAYRRKRMRARNRNAAAIDCYLELVRLEAWGGEVPEEAFALAEKARFSRHKLTRTERAAMLGHVAEQRTRIWNGLSRRKRLLFWLSGL